MKPNPLVSLLVGSAVLTGYAILRLADNLPRYFIVAYGLEPGEVRNFMPIPTTFAVENSWIFVLLLSAVLMSSILALRLSRNSVRVVVNGLCLQWMLLWIAMFCYCYEGFSGPFSLRSGPKFSLIQFLTFEMALFPVSFLGILLPIVITFQRNPPTQAPSPPP